MRTRNQHARRRGGRAAASFVAIASLALAGLTALFATGSATAAPAAGSYSLSNAASGLCLEVPGAGTSDGVQLGQRSCSGASNQTWQLKASGSGYTLAAGHSAKCAGVRDASTSAGKAVEQQSCTGGAEPGVDARPGQRRHVPGRQRQWRQVPERQGQFDRGRLPWSSRTPATR